MPTATPGTHDRHVMTSDSATHAPVSMDQEDLFLRNRVTASDADQNLLLIFELGDDFRAASLDRALTRLVRKYPELRSRFGRGADGRVFRSQLERDSIPLTTMSIEADEVWEGPVRDFGARPIDLEIGPPVAGLLISRQGRAVVLALSLHHIIVDGPSVKLIESELQAGYAADHEERPRLASETMPSDAVQAGDAVALQSESVKAEAVDYWRSELAGFEQLQLPRTGTEGEGVGAFSLALDPEATATLARIGLQHRASMTGVLCAAFHAWIRTTFDRTDTLTSVVVGTRDEAGAVGVIGNFLRVVPVRIQAGDDLTYTALTRAVGRKLRKGSSHAVPQRVLRAQARKGGARGDLLDFMLVHHGEASDRADHEHAELVRRWLPRVGTRHAVEINTVVLDGHLRMEVTFGGELPDQRCADERRLRFASVLEAIAASSGSAVRSARQEG